MDAKRFFAAATVASLLAETLHAGDSNAAGKPHFPFWTSAAQETHFQPHTHSDLQAEGHLLARAQKALFAGRRQRELYRFTSIAPLRSGLLRLVAAPASGFGLGSQLMYGICAMQDFLDWLTPRLSAAQFSAFRRRYSGESSEPVQLRVFDRRELERFGMTFRPLDDCDPPMFARLTGRA